VKTRNSKDGGLFAHILPLPLESQSSAFNSQTGKHVSISTGACTHLMFATAETRSLAHCVGKGHF